MSIAQPVPLENGRLVVRPTGEELMASCTQTRDEHILET
jgi:hypothetical protein